MCMNINLSPNHNESANFCCYVIFFNTNLSGCLGRTFKWHNMLSHNSINQCALLKCKFCLAVCYCSACSTRCDLCVRLGSTGRGVALQPFEKLLWTLAIVCLCCNVCRRSGRTSSTICLDFCFLFSSFWSSRAHKSLSSWSTFSSVER